jgi:hypothetical protein
MSYHHPRGSQCGAQQLIVSSQHDPWTVSKAFKEYFLSFLETRNQNFFQSLDICLSIRVNCRLVNPTTVAAANWIFFQQRE